MRRSFSLILILAGASLAAPASAQPGRGLFVSPAGEPFRRSDSAPQPMRAWFEQADSDHDGALGWAEFEADFVRWFGLLDADHDGEVAPAEVERYEQQILPEMQSRTGGGSFRPGMRMGGRRNDGVGGGGRRGMQNRGGRRGAPGMGALAMMSGAARFGLLPIAHPVMDADTNFNRGVTREEFTQAAARRFAMLNTQNDGRLTLAQLIEVRRQGFDSGRRDSPGLGPAEDSEGEPPAEDE
ncbi:MAG TPA: EF-hand domain-containing protein [Allosphingosinicella sp.]|nr:EF-hand domain-containing protein [Allosphingosinicella sp.]